MKKLYLMFPEKIATIAPEVYGHFSEQIGGVFYDGLWVGRDSKVPNYNGFRKSIVDAMRKIRIPVLRWPGGCFAETYDWRDGIGENRPTRIQWWTRNDGRLEDNSVGTHEFLELCELVGAKPYMAANVTSLRPLDIRDWVCYCTDPEGSTTLAKERAKNGHPAPYDIPYWGVGNENWGGGGNMTPEMYGDEYRRYSAIMFNVPTCKNLIVGGANGADYDWTRRFFARMEKSEKRMNGYSFHYYCGSAGDHVKFSDDDWYQLLMQASRMETLIKRHWGTIESYGMTEKGKLVIDEWGCWSHGDLSSPSHGYNLFEQNSTMRDAFVCALTLNIFNNHSDKIMMANVAQLVNNIQCLFFAHEDHCVETPVYHIFDMYKEHMGADAIRTAVDNKVMTWGDGKDKALNQLSVSASVKDGYATLTVANASLTDDEVLDLCGVGSELATTAEVTMLRHDNVRAYNSFEEPDVIVPTTETVDLTKGLSVPKSSVVSVRIAVK